MHSLTYMKGKTADLTVSVCVSVWGGGGTEGFFMGNIRPSYSIYCSSSYSDPLSFEEEEEEEEEQDEEEEEEVGGERLPSESSWSSWIYVKCTCALTFPRDGERTAAGLRAPIFIFHRWQRPDAQTPPPTVDWTR